MALPKYIPRYSVEEYQQWPGDWELNGEDGYTESDSLRLSLHSDCQLRLDPAGLFR